MLLLRQVQSVFWLASFIAFAKAQQDPTTMNGGSILAMAGNKCVAVAVDKRFGSGPQVRPVPYV
jgi:20S proteasome alpha/beta subunit